NPLLAYNVAFFASFVLCALSAYALTFSIARRHDAALVAGLAFGFAPYRMSQLGHVQVLSAYWMPLALAGLHQYFATRRTRWLVLFAGGWLMQGLSCGYYLFFLSVLVGLWLLWFGATREHWQSVARVMVTSVVAAVLIAPVLYGYWKFQHTYGMRRWPDEIISFSADVASVLKAPENLLFWRWLDVVNHPESSLFPGLTPVLLIVVGLALGWRATGREHTGRLRISRVLVAFSLIFFAVAASPAYFGTWKIEIAGVRLLSVGTPHKPMSVAVLLLLTAGALHPSVRSAWRRRSPLAFYALAAVVMWLFSLGPAPTLMDRPVIYKAPYAWLMELPGADGIRVPARFWVLATLCLAVAAGLALRQLGARWPRLTRALPALACAGLIVDAFPTSTVPLQGAPARRPSHVRAVARLELPVNPEHDPIVLYRAIEHRRPVVNGYSGYFAPHYWALRYLLEQGDPGVLTRLSSMGVIEVVVDHARDVDTRWRRFVASHPQAELVNQDDEYTTYRVPRGPRTIHLERIDGEVLPVISIAAAESAALVGGMTDGDLLTRWHAGREQRPGDAISVDLGRLRQVSGLEMLIAGYIADFPRELSIATSVDGATWSDAWSGGTAMIAFAAALEDPLRVTLPFGFAPRPARYLRLTQTGRERLYYWSVAELLIRGH
ncbi:MAG: discoidin domain-containing protein, partial [Acidobacteriota bacterium]|nr:discoidin domain-containing protein [Acidobacteriota bacterium]